MKRSRLSVMTALILVLALSLPALAAPGGGRGPGQKKHAWKFEEKVEARFRDMAEAAWATPDVGLMAELGIVTGYGNGTFQPNKPVTRGEFLTMLVRATVDDADTVAESVYEEHFDFADDAAIPGWVRGYIALAIEAGYLDEGGVLQPERPATRAWVASLLSVADGDEDGQPETTADLTDLNEVSGEEVEGVLEAIADGYFRGYPDGSFQPNKPITRAEVAKVLAEFLGSEQVEVPLEHLYKGKLVELTADAITFTVKGVDLTLPLGDEYGVYLNDEPASAADLVAGMNVRVLTEGDLETEVVTLIMAKVEEEEEDEEFEVKGVVEAVDTADGEITLVDDGRLYLVNGDTEYEGIDDLAALTVGDLVELAGYVQGEEYVVEKLKAEAPEPEEFEVKGVVEAVNAAAGQITLLDDERLFVVDDATKYKGIRSLDELQAGAVVEIEGVVDGDEYRVSSLTVEKREDGKGSDGDGN